MAVSSAGFGSRSSKLFLALAFGVVGSFVGCGSETSSKTEVLVSIDAIGEAKQSTSVRIEVNAAVVELPRTKDWPFEVLVSASDDSDTTFKMRAFGLRDNMVMGGAKRDGTFKKGKRTGLEVTLDPSADIGSLPAVNAEVGPGKIVVQPQPNPELDGGDDFDAGTMDSGFLADGAIDTNDASDNADGGAGGCGVGQACDAAVTQDACVPSATDCGGCGKTCANDRQCVSEQCVPIPPSSCTSAMSIDGRLYRYCSDMRSWDSARIACREMGYDLVIFDTLTEYSNVKAKFPAATDCWLGGHDRGDNGSGASACTKTSAEGVWRWVNPQTGTEQGTEFCRFVNSNSTSCTATAGAFFTWTSGQPDNDGCSCGVLNLGACSNGEDCLAMGTNGWNDAECTEARTYLCEEK